MSTSVPAQATEQKNAQAEEMQAQRDASVKDNLNKKYSIRQRLARFFNTCRWWLL
jgi:hypothetical protein